MTEAATARLVFVGGLTPVVLDGAELNRDYLGQGYSQLAGWAVPGTRPPSGELCLARVELAGEAWAVADAHLDVSNSGTARDWVSVTWRTGHELDAFDDGADVSGEGLPWLLRARALELVSAEELVDTVVRYAVAVASGHRDPRWVRRLAQACVELRGRRRAALRRVAVRPVAAEDPVRLLHEVMAAGGHLPTTAGTVQALLRSGSHRGRGRPHSGRCCLRKGLPRQPPTPGIRRPGTSSGLPGSW
ncbi:hypothetical protein [Streptomyces narbonensis]|uniref:hypothetical protein n=1 Tax=Streptomyces narbonensis TaxID=67333 RepID=UPI0033F10434